MNDASLSDEISIRHLTFTINALRDAITLLNQHAGDMEQRLARLESPPTAGAAYTTPEGWEAKQRAAESRQFAHHIQVAKWLEAGRYRLLMHRHTGTFVATDESEQKTVGAATIPLLADALINWPEGAQPTTPTKWVRAQEWRDAKSDPPVRDGVFLAYLTGRPPSSRYMIGSFDRMTGAWDTEDGALVTSYVTHWQELPTPPQPTNPA